MIHQKLQNRKYTIVWENKTYTQDKVHRVIVKIRKYVILYTKTTASYDYSCIPEINYQPTWCGILEDHFHILVQRNIPAYKFWTSIFSHNLKNKRVYSVKVKKLSKQPVFQNTFWHRWSEFHLLEVCFLM